MALDADVYNAAISDGMPPALALLIVAQSKHESDNYTSSLFVDCNNAFGYGYGSDTCGSHNYKGYNNIADSTYDITGWIQRHFSADEINNTTTPEQYATLLSNYGYYTDTIANYAAGLENWFETNIPGGVATGAGLGIIIAIAVFFFVIKKKKPKI